MEVLKDPARVSLQSSNLKSAAWADDTLSIEFHNGSTYEYCAVPHKVFEELVSAPSAGKYFAGNIRPVYTHKCVSRVTG